MSSHPIPTKEFTLLTALMMSIVAISIDALLPALGIIGGHYGVSNPNQVQLIIGCIFGGMAVGQLVAGPMSDALGRKPVLYAGVALYLVGSVVCYFSDSFALLLAGRVIQGLGVSAPYVTAVSVVRDKYSGRDMARIMSLVMMIFIMVPALAPTLGQAVMHIADWRAIFLVYILYALAIVVWIAFRLEETLPPERRMKLQPQAFVHGFKTVIGNKPTLLYMICMGLCFGSFIGYLGASQQIFQDQFGVGEAFALYFGGLALVFGAASLVNSRIVGRLGMRVICRGGMSVVALSALVFLGVHGAVSQVTLPMFVIYATFTFFSFGLLFGNLNAIAMESMGDVAGMASAIIGAVSSVLSLALGTMIGQMYDNTLVPIVTGFLVCSMAALVIMQIEQAWYRRQLSSAAS